MPRFALSLFYTPLLTLFVAGVPVPALGQNVESVGTRALAMGGAFVAVANDSSATWWNPAGLAAGPFLDVAITRNSSRADERLPAGSTGAWSFTFATPPFGISFYRLRITDIRPLVPTAQDRADREEGRAGMGVRSLSVSQFGATILHTLFTGVHVGTTVKYVRGISRAVLLEEIETALIHVPSLLDTGEDLEGGDGRGTADLDAGILAVVGGGFRAGAVIRNAREPEFEPSTGSGPSEAESDGDGVRLPRQVRVGAAFDGEAIGRRPFTVALDADVRRYDAGSGERRVIALGAEHWFWSRRLGVRGGGRFNTVGARDEAVTAGASIAARPGMYVDAYVVGGSAGAEDGWGVSARISF